MPDREDPFTGFSFGLEITGKLAGYFTNCSGIGSETEIVEHKVVDPAGRSIIQKIPGRLKFTDVTLKRGVTSNKDIWDWRQEVVDGKIVGARRNCSIIAYDEAFKEVARWNFENAWPSKVTGPEMDAGSTNYMIEEVTIVHEGMERVA